MASVSEIEITNRSEKKKRYVVCNHQDVTELLWENLELFGSKIASDNDNNSLNEGINSKFVLSTCMTREIV